MSKPASAVEHAVEKRSSLALRLVGVLGLFLTGSIIAVCLIGTMLIVVFGGLLLLFSGGAWAPLLGGG